MKKFFMIAVMAVASIAANAQKGEYFVTPHLNAGYATISNNDSHGGMLYGLGCDFEYMVSDQFGLSAGVDFNYLQGDKYKETVIPLTGGGEPYSWELTYTMGFLNIPILANYHFGNFAVKAGIQPAFLVSPKGDVKFTYGSETVSKSNDTSSNFNTFQFGIPVGISYTFNSPVTLGLNVTIPVTNLGKEEAVEATQQKSKKVLPILLSVGYRF